MELDDHISKYIDSELTEEEDVLLRKLLSEDDYAREKFNSAVSVHLAMKEDSESIETPEDILRQTEDIVLMKILASQPIVIERPLFWRRSQLLAAMIVFFIFSFIFQIDDMKIGRPGGEVRDASAKLSEAIENENEQNLAASPEGNIKNRTSSSARRISTTDLAVSTLSTSSGGGVGRVDVVLSDASDDFRSRVETTGPTTALQPAPPVSDNTIYNEKKDASKPAMVLNNLTDELKRDEKPEVENRKTEKNVTNSLVVNKPKADMKFSNNASEPIQMKPGEANTEVFFSSFLGTDFIRTGFDNGEKLAVTNFSQSIAYSINNDEKMGIEIGYSEYTYKENVILSTPYQTLKSGKASVIETSDLEIPIGVDLYDNLISIESQRQMVWGSAFYERSLFRTEDLSLEGRLGLGLSHDGLLGYGRFFGIYEFIKGFSFTIGADGRLFQANLPGESVSGRLKSSATVIYGLQVKF